MAVQHWGKNNTSTKNNNNKILFSQYWNWKYPQKKRVKGSIVITCTRVKQPLVVLWDSREELPSSLYKNANAPAPPANFPDMSAQNKSNKKVNLNVTIESNDA